MLTIDKSENDIWDNYWQGKLQKTQRLDVDNPLEYIDPYTLRYTQKVLGAVNDIIWITEWSKLLELGCGTGKNGIIMQAQHKTQTTLLDSSKSALEYADFLSHALGEEICLVQWDMFSIPFEKEEFDIVFNWGTVEHYSTKVACGLIDEMKRITKKWGYVVIYVPNLINPQILMYHLKIKLGLQKNIIWIPNERYYNHKKLKELFQKCGFHLSDIHVTSIDHVFPHNCSIEFMNKHNNIEKFVKDYLGFFHLVVAQKK